MLFVNPTDALRRDLRQIVTLAQTGQLSPERLAAIKDRAYRSLAEIDEKLRDDEHFEITLEGLSALHKGGKPVRFSGHLVVIDGGRT
ncbi:MAG TPA: hypothetical protein VMU59_14230 [Caulobacteraceae bacterium]|nr:hypothetical protein [Caulobacteraceae bacterium]